MFNRKGQSTLEYAMIIAVIVAGLLLMQHYIKRGYSGRLKNASDDLGEQYDPGVYTGNYQISQTSGTKQTVQNKITNTEHTEAQQNIKIGYETVGAFDPSKNVYGQ
jgi:uncharacterized protein (UPF0333 family)